VRIALAIGFLLLGACDCSPRAGSKTFVCTSDGECAEGFRCISGVCSTGGAAGGHGGGVAGGGAAQGGGSEAGGAEAGGAEAGGAEAGGGEAGGSTAGGSTAGGGTSGGATAGGATAGGATAGGATAGGATAGGATAGGATAGGATAGGAVNPPTSLVFITSPPAPLLAGACFVATVEARIGAAATPVASDTTVGLSVSLTNGSRFYSDAACTMTAATATIPGGTANGTFYVKPLTGLFQTVTATAPFGMATQSFTPRPIVRRGTCDYDPVNLSDGGVIPDYQQDCSITPNQTNLGRTMLFTTTTANSSTSGVLMSRCFFLDTGTVRCHRGRGTSSPDVHWQSVELPQGLTVNHVSNACPGSAGANITWATPVNPASTFVLASSENTGSSFDDDESFTVRLTSPTTARFEADGCDDYTVQIVDFAGVTVTRDVIDAGFPVGTASLTLQNLPASSANTAVLVQARTSLGSLIDGECSMLLRADLPSNSSVTLSRGAGVAGVCVADPIDQIVVERIDFGTKANVQKLTASFAAGVAQLNVAVSPVDTTRAVVFSSSQVLGGQGAAEIDQEEVGEAGLRLELTSSTNVRINRGDQDGLTTVTFFVVEIEP